MREDTPSAPGMRGPVLSSVSSQRGVVDAVTVDAIVQSEKNAKGTLVQGLYVPRQVGCNRLRHL